MNRAAVRGWIASIIESRLNVMKTPSAPSTANGTRVRSKRPVTAATAMTTAKTMSGGAGSSLTTASSRNPSATATS